MAKYMSTNCSVFDEAKNDTDWVVVSISCFGNGKKMNQKRPISVSQMAKTAGFSRQRFYDLVKKGIFPEPDEIWVAANVYKGPTGRRAGRL